MTIKRRTKLVREGQYVAEVQVELIEDETGWAPYLSVEEAQKLDDIRQALRNSDIKAASKLGTVFKLTPV